MNDNSMICADCGAEWDAANLSPCPECGSARTASLPSLLPLLEAQHGKAWRAACFPHRAKVRFVVIGEGALAYVLPELPKQGQVLVSHATKGALGIREGDAVLLQFNEHRPATRADFEAFRVSSEGYSTDPRYDFPSA